MFPGLHPMAMMSTTNRGAYCGAPPPFAPPLFTPVPGQNNSQQGSSDYQVNRDNFVSGNYFVGLVKFNFSILLIGNNLPLHSE